MHTALRLSADLSSAAVARRSVESFARELGIDATTASLVATELVTNAVRHGSEPIVLHLRFDHDALFVEVSDCGRGQPRLRSPSLRADGHGGGLGLLLVEQLSRNWGVRASPRGFKTVWAEVDCGPVTEADDVIPGLEGLVPSRARRER